MKINVIKVDYDNPKHAKDLIYLLDSYARDEMGGSSALKDEVKDSLIPTMKNLPNIFSFIAYEGDSGVGFANCIESFSTFACKKIINIHDIAVLTGKRGKGIGQSLLATIENQAKEMDCCKITLEVLEGNKLAQNSYRKFGFSEYELNPENGKALFFEKKLDHSSK